MTKQGANQKKISPTGCKQAWKVSYQGPANETKSNKKKKKKEARNQFGSDMLG